MKAYVRVREDGRFLAYTDEHGSSFVTVQGAARAFVSMDEARQVAASFPFACDVVLLSHNRTVASNVIEGAGGRTE